MGTRRGRGAPGEHDMGVGLLVHCVGNGVGVGHTVLNASAGWEQGGARGCDAGTWAWKLRPDAGLEPDVRALP